jgi:hypothetical protein
MVAWTEIAPLAVLKIDPPVPDSASWLSPWVQESAANSKLDGAR